MRLLMLWTAKVVALVFGAWLGYVAGFLIAYYSVDYGDVGSAAATIVWVPIGVLVCSTSAYLIAAFALRRFEVSKSNAQP